MKVAINKDEWYPIYFIHTQEVDFDTLPTFEIDDELYIRAERAKREFAQIQAELANIYES